MLIYIYIYIYIYIHSFFSSFKSYSLNFIEDILHLVLAFVAFAGSIATPGSVARFGVVWCIEIFYKFIVVNNLILKL